MKDIENEEVTVLCQDARLKTRSRCLPHLSDSYCQWYRPSHNITRCKVCCYHTLQILKYNSCVRSDPYITTNHGRWLAVPQGMSGLTVLATCRRQIWQTASTTKRCKHIPENIIPPAPGTSAGRLPILFLYPISFMRKAPYRNTCASSSHKFHDVPAVTRPSPNKQCI